MIKLKYLPALAFTGLLGCVDTSTSPSAEKPAGSDAAGMEQVTVDQETIDRLRQDILNNGIYKPVPENRARSLSKTAAPTGATMAFPMKDPRASCPGGYIYYFQDDEQGNQMELYQEDVTSFTIQTKIDYATLTPFLSAGGLEFPRVRRNAGSTESRYRDTQITFCREWVDYLPQDTKNDYVVISADGYCPLNSYRYEKLIDNENTGNISFVEPSNLGGIRVEPNLPFYRYAGDSHITMCYVPRNPFWRDVLPKKYSERYWFFTNASLANYRGSIYMDNENKSNRNSWTVVGNTTFLPFVKGIMGDGPNTRWYFAGLDDGYAPLVFQNKHSARYAAQLTCANNRDVGYTAANAKALGTAANKALATTKADWTALKGTLDGWADYAGSFLTTNTAYDNCMSQAQLIVE